MSAELLGHQPAAHNGPRCCAACRRAWINREVRIAGPLLGRVHSALYLLERIGPEARPEADALRVWLDRVPLARREEGARLEQRIEKQAALERAARATRA